MASLSLHRVSRVTTHLTNPPCTLPLCARVSVRHAPSTQSSGHALRYTVTVPRNVAIFTTRSMGGGYRRGLVLEAETRIRASAERKAKQIARALAKRTSSRKLLDTSPSRHTDNSATPRSLGQRSAASAVSTRSPPTKRKDLYGTLTMGPSTAQHGTPTHASAGRGGTSRDIVSPHKRHRLSNTATPATNMNMNMNMNMGMHANTHASTVEAAAPTAAESDRIWVETSPNVAPVHTARVGSPGWPAGTPSRGSRRTPITALTRSPSKLTPRAYRTQRHHSPVLSTAGTPGAMSVASSSTSPRRAGSSALGASRDRVRVPDIVTTPHAMTPGFIPRQVSDVDLVLTREISRLQEEEEEAAAAAVLSAPVNKPTPRFRRSGSDRLSDRSSSGTTSPARSPRATGGSSRSLKGVAAGPPAEAEEEASVEELGKQLAQVEAEQRASRVVNAFLPDHGKRRAMAAAKTAGAQAALSGKSLRGIATAVAKAAADTFNCGSRVRGQVVKASVEALGTVPGLLVLVADENIDSADAAEAHSLKTMQVGPGAL